MNLNLDYLFKIGLFMGLVLLVVSLFFEWYSFKMIDESQTLMTSWKFNIFFEWYTEIPNSVETNKLFKPSTLSFPWILNIVLIIIIIISGYITISNNFEDRKVTEKTRFHSEIYIILLSLNFFYYWCFPVFFLFPNDLFFPYLTYKDFSTGYTYIYSIGLGYIFNMLAFLLIFPYTVFFIYITSRYKKEDSLSFQRIAAQGRDLYSNLNLDKLIIIEQEKAKKNLENINEVRQ